MTPIETTATWGGFTSDGMLKCPRLMQISAFRAAGSYEFQSEVTRSAEGVPMSSVEVKRSVLSVALVATWFIALFAVGAAIAGLLI